MQKFILEGCTWNGEKFVFNWQQDSPDDIIEFFNKTYKHKRNKIQSYFCFKIKKVKGANNAEIFRKELKKNSALINENDKQKLIELGVKKFVSEIKDIESIIFPKSSSTLVNEISKEVHKYFPDALFLPEALIKNDIDKIKIDFEKYIKTAKDETNVKKRIGDLNRDLSRATKDGNFQIKKVHNFRRKVFSNFMKVQDSKTVKKVYGKKVLLIDDVFTTGSTMAEILRILNEFEPKEIIFLALMY